MILLSRNTLYSAASWHCCNLIVTTLQSADLARTAAMLFIMLARQSGTRCQMNLEILTASIVSNGF